MHMRHTFAPGLVLALVSGSVGLLATRTQQAPERPPAPTLTRPATPTKAPDADGFLRRWLVLEPIRVPGQLTDSAVRDGSSRPSTSRSTDDDPAPWRHGDGRRRRTDLARRRHARNYNVNLYHFAYALKKPTSNVLFWAVTVVNVPRELTGVRLAIGSNAASIWWVNGEEVIGLYNDRQAVIDDGVSNRLTLKQGPNVIRAAIINAGGATDFCARLLDADDRPIKTVTVELPVSRK